MREASPNPWPETETTMDNTTWKITVTYYRRDRTFGALNLIAEVTADEAITLAEDLRNRARDFGTVQASRIESVK